MSAIYAPTGEKLAYITRMLDGVAIVILNESLQRRFGSELRVDHGSEERECAAILSAYLTAPQASRPRFPRLV